jgi:hypothetical protein
LNFENLAWKLQENPVTGKTASPVHHSDADGIKSVYSGFKFLPFNKLDT